MIVKGNNGKSPARKRQPVAASSSAVKTRSNSVPKGSSRSNNGKATDKLDGNINHIESTALESEAGDRILEETGIAEGTPRDGLSSGSTELTAVTLHQPWASLIAQGKKHYETRDWSTDYRGPIAIHAGKKFQKDESLISLLEIPATEVPLGAVVAIAQMTDCILMTEEFISQQIETELRCGCWQVGRYAWKLENVRAIEPIPATGKQSLWKWSSDSWNPADFGELHHVAEADGQLNLLDWTDKEPPEPDDYASIEQFDEAYKQWEDSQQSTVNNEELCNQLMDGSICAAELVPASLLPESNSGEEARTISVSGMDTVNVFSRSDTLASDTLATSNCSTLLTLSESTIDQNSLQLPLPANHSAKTENDLPAETIAIASLMCSEQFETCNPTLPSSKTSSDFSTALTPLVTNQEAILATSSTSYRQVGTMRNGFVSGVMNLPLPGVGKGYLLLRSPGALSHSGKASPPGKTRLESQLLELGLISTQEVAAPEFLELGYQLPIGWTNLQENRTANELVQALQLPIDLKSESPAVMETTAIDVQPSEMPLTGESQQLGLSESSTLPNLSPELAESWTDWEKSNFLWLFEFDFCMHKGELKKIEKFLPGTKTIRLEGMKIGSTYLQMWEVEPPRFTDKSTLIELPPNIGALEKAELISMAQEQHQLICLIERKEFELALEKLHRVRLTGVYLQEFKKKCQYGEFENQLEQAGIGVRSAQNYMTIAKNWDIVEAKTKLVALLSEENQPAIGLKWAIEAVRDQKKQLKSAAPPKDPDSWRTPNTKEQPIVDLVKQALGGEIYCDPCSDAGHRIPARLHYNSSSDGLNPYQTWAKTCFINPPFSNPSPWVEKCCLSYARGEVSAAVMLLKAGTLSNVGTGELINKYASAVCHWRGRINFLNDEGNAVKGSDFDCVLIYFGARLDLFRKAFSGRGTISTIDNHYSSVNKKFTAEPEPDSVRQEERQLAAAVGLSNGKSLLPDRRDDDRELLERYDPHTVSHEFMPSQVLPKVSPEIEADYDDKFDQAKRSCLADYITAISSNISDFSDDQLAFLAKIINDESVKRIRF